MLRQRIISAAILTVIGLLVYFLRDDFLTYLVALIASISLFRILKSKVFKLNLYIYSDFFSDTNVSYTFNFFLVICL